jgi:hypothetical protein
VAVAAEAAPRAATGDGPRLLAHLVALRFGSGDTFARHGWVPPSRFPNPCHLEHMGVTAAALRAGARADELRQAWASFLREDDLVVAWKQSTFELLRDTVGAPPNRLQLKSAYCSHVKGSCGSLRKLVERLGMQPRGLLDGRAGQHLGHLAQLIEHLRRDAG